MKLLKLSAAIDCVTLLIISIILDLLVTALTGNSLETGGVYTACQKTTRKEYIIHHDLNTADGV